MRDNSSTPKQFNTNPQHFIEGYIVIYCGISESTYTTPQAAAQWTRKKKTL